MTTVDLIDPAIWVRQYTQTSLYKPACEINFPVAVPKIRKFISSLIFIDQYIRPR